MSSSYLPRLTSRAQIDLGLGCSSLSWQARSGSAYRQPSGSGPSRSGLAGLRFIPSLCFLSLSLLSDSPPLLFLPWQRRRLGERRRHLSRLRPAICRRRASSRYVRPFYFLLLCKTEHPKP